MSRIKLRINTLTDVINKLCVDESRFINCCLLGTHQGERFRKEQYFPVDIARYARQGNISMANAIDELLDICAKHKESFNINIGGGNILCTSLIYEYIWNMDNRTLHINWNPKFIPYISGYMFPGDFVFIDTRMDEVPSNLRYAMYILIEKNLWKLDNKNEECVIRLSEITIRNELNIGTKYRELNIINSKIIKPSLKAIYNKLGIGLESKIIRKQIEINRIK